MAFSFRPAVATDRHLLISLAGGSGSGKTYSAMRLATGMSGGKPFAVIDTEAGRATHYADQFRFDHGDLKPPFRPEAYTEAIHAGDEAGYPVIVVDSASHEHAGEGGLLEWHEDELQRMAGNDPKKRDSCLQAAWIKPKAANKKMVNKLIQIRAHIILCLRAEEKIEMYRDDNGKMKVRPKRSAAGLDGWIPICEKGLPYEMTCSFLLHWDRPGVPRPIKLQEQHRRFFPDGEPITEETGKRLAEWAAGAKVQPAPAKAPKPEMNKLETTAREVAKMGTARLKQYWDKLPRDDKIALKPILADIQQEAAKHDDPAPFGVEVPMVDAAGNPLTNLSAG